MPDELPTPFLANVLWDRSAPRWDERHMFRNPSWRVPDLNIPLRHLRRGQERVGGREPRSDWDVTPTGLLPMYDGDYANHSQMRRSQWFASFVCRLLVIEPVTIA